MGYSYRNNGKITDFWPDNTPDEFYLSSESPFSMKELIGYIEAYWNCDINFDQIKISSENIHTTCLTYDLHDYSDYTQFLVIRKLK